MGIPGPAALFYSGRGVSRLVSHDENVSDWSIRYFENNGLLGSRSSLYNCIPSFYMFLNNIYSSDVAISPI